MDHRLTTTTPLTDHRRAWLVAHEAVAQRFIRFGPDITDAALAAELLDAYQRLTAGPLPPAIAGEVAGTAAALARELDARRGLGSESWTAHGIAMRERRPGGCR